MPDGVVQRFDAATGEEHVGDDPADVARAWAAALAAKSIDDALVLYAPDAVVHLDDTGSAGRRQLHTYLEESPIFGALDPTSVRGDGDVAMLRWDPPVVPAAVEVRCRVTHGLIAEQWGP